LALLRQRADVGNDAADLVDGANLGGALARVHGKDRIEMRVEGEEHRGPMEARNITHSTAFLTIRRKLCT
jgi:hypothetical protein